MVYFEVGVYFLVSVVVIVDFHLLCSMTKLKEHSREICYMLALLLEMTMVKLMVVVMMKLILVLQVVVVFAQAYRVHLALG